jgi:hypothetical protein
LGHLSDETCIECTDTGVCGQYHQRLVSRWSVAIDADRYRADSVKKYELYFELLEEKIQKYDLEPSEIYNLDEKGFMLGHLGRSKPIFDKAS